MAKISRLLQPESYTTNRQEVFRYNASGLGVEIARPNFSASHITSEANLARLLGRLGSTVDFILMTSFRAADFETGAPRSKSANEELFTKLPGKLRTELGSKRIGAYWLLCHWTSCLRSDNGGTLNECEATGGNVIDNLEYSWLLTRDDDDISPRAWLGAAQVISALYHQDAFVIRLDGHTTLRSETGEVWDDLSTDETVTKVWASLADMRANNKPCRFTEGRKPGRRQPIIFGPGEMTDDATTAAYRANGSGQCYTADFFVARPINNMSAQLFQAMGIKHML